MRRSAQIHSPKSMNPTRPSSSTSKLPANAEHYNQLQSTVQRCSYRFNLDRTFRDHKITEKSRMITRASPAWTSAWKLLAPITVPNHVLSALTSTSVGSARVMLLIASRSVSGTPFSFSITNTLQKQSKLGASESAYWTAYSWIQLPVKQLTSENTVNYLIDVAVEDIREVKRSVVQCPMMGRWYFANATSDIRRSSGA